MKKTIFVLATMLLLAGCATTGQNTLINDNSTDMEQSETITQPPALPSDDEEVADDNVTPTKTDETVMTTAPQPPALPND